MGFLMSYSLTIDFDLYDEVGEAGDFAVVSSTWTSAVSEFVKS